MKLYFMKHEAVEFIKCNLETLYENYYKEEDNQWVIDLVEKELGFHPFVEFKSIEDFSLFEISSAKSKGDIDFNNCKILYEKLKFLTDSQACDERLWVGLCHSVFYQYIRERWGYNNKDQIKTDAVSNLKSRFFIAESKRAGLYRNTLSKCWWVGRLTYDSKNENRFALLDSLGSNDISTKISDLFYSNNYSSNPEILKGIIDGIQYFNSQNINILVREHLRPTLQYLNVIGGYFLLDQMTREQIRDIVIKNIEEIKYKEERLKII